MNTKVCDFILVIFNCKKYRYKALKQKQTWLKNFSIMPFFHVIGDPSMEKDYLFDETEHILYVKTPDDYISLPKKVISAYEALNKEFIFRYIFKTDDDQNLIKNDFLNIIKQLCLTRIPKIHYAGNIINVDKPYLSLYSEIHSELPKNLPILQTKYCTGRFYILSDLAVQQLITKKHKISNEYLEDYAIGFYLDPIIKQHIFNIQTNKYFIDFDNFD